MADAVRLRIDRLGRRGEGVAVNDGAPVYVAYALPGETAVAELAGDRGLLVGIENARQDRIRPICPYFGRCGGCAVQALAPEPYAAWKRDLVATALAQAGVTAEVGGLVDGHGAGRRRATFHARAGRDGASRIGFMEARSHAIVEIDRCPILAPSMAGSIEAASRIARLLSDGGKPLDMLVTAFEAGLDVELRGYGPLGEPLRRRLVAAATELGLARLANHGDVLVEARVPLLRLGAALVAPPPGTFLQATQRGEEILAERVSAGVAGAERIVDLFCGIGTFALRLGHTATLEAFDADEVAIAALARAVHGTPGLRGIKAATRDLFKRPLRPEELTGVDAVVFDPPRAGAVSQATELARSRVPTLVAVSCDPGTFARDAAALTAGGYRLESVTPIDQFRYAAHVEIVGIFRRAPAKKRRRLLS